MKVEVRNRKIKNIALSCELLLSRSRLQNDFGLLILIESLLVHSLQDLDRLSETGLKLGEGLLGVFKSDGLGFTHADGDALGGVGDSLDWEVLVKS